jgi:RNA polymerase sigma-70 factor (TIGR02960 family)
VTEVAAAGTVDAVDFAGIADPFRSELLAHCYRMLGSRFDAEDAVQETYVRAWRGYERFAGRSSVRRWLYTIATRVCLTALEHRSRRPLPSGFGASAFGGDAGAEWLEPLPDALLRTDDADPASVVASRAGVRLAFVAALQYLPARQRAVLVLRDVLAWPAAAVAQMLETSVPAVNSSLQRARDRLRSLGLSADELAEPREPELKALLDQYATAFATGDVAPLVALLRADIALEMPPQPAWFRGRDAVLGFLAANVLRGPGRWRLEATRANGQPAFDVYERDSQPHGLTVLTLAGPLVSRITAFNDPRHLTRADFGRG